MGMKHRITINVDHKNVLRAAELRLPQRLVRFLFGDFTQVYLLTPGQSVESVDVREVVHE